MGTHRCCWGKPNISKRENPDESGRPDNSAHDLQVTSASFLTLFLARELQQTFQCFGVWISCILCHKRNFSLSLATSPERRTQELPTSWRSCVCKKQKFMTGIKYLFLLALVRRKPELWNESIKKNNIKESPRNFSLFLSFLFCCFGISYKNSKLIRWFVHLSPSPRLTPHTSTPWMTFFVVVAFFFTFFWNRSFVCRWRWQTHFNDIKYCETTRAVIMSHVIWDHRK